MFDYVKPSSPCVLCGKTTDCRTNISGGIHCRRTDRNNPPPGWRYVKEDGHGFGLYHRDGTHEPILSNWAEKRIAGEIEAKKNRKGRENRLRETKIDTGTTAFDRIAADMRPMTDAERNSLAYHLTLPLRSFDLLGVQFLPTDDFNQPAFVFTERDAKDNIVGYTLRYTDGSKRNHGHRGLYIPVNWSDVDPGGPIYLCEGASDTLALVCMGLNAVGRPSNTGGLAHLAELLHGLPSSRHIIVLGENDRRDTPDGEAWPGREGMESTAQKLADELQRAVYTAMPPETSNGVKVKDVREIVEANEEAIRNRSTTFADLGRQFAAHVQSVAAKVITSSQIDQPSIAEVTSRFTNVGFTAAEFHPPPDPNGFTAEHSTSSPPRCPSPKIVILRCDADRMNRVMFVDCKRLSCPHCHTIKRAQYHATIKHHLTHYSNCNLPVYVFTCAVDDWDTVSSNLRDKFASNFNLATDDDTLLVVATERPTSAAAENIEEMSCADAITRLCDAVSNLRELRPKGFNGSRDWKLVGQPDRSAKKADRRWRRVGRIDVPMQTVFEILEHHKIAWQPVTKRSAFWGWTAWQWHDSQSKSAHKKVFNDLDMGEIMITYEWAPEPSTRSTSAAVDPWGPETCTSSAAEPTPGGYALDW